MQLAFQRRLLSRVVLLVVGCLTLAMTAASASSARVTTTTSTTATRGGRAAAVALAAPSAGDVSYAMVRVRVAAGGLAVPSGLRAQPTVFSERIGGLAVRARSAQWRALRATTRVYVVVAAVPGAAASERDVALFILRRAGHRAPASARVTFTIGNARAQIGSFWVHGVDRDGYADVFHARNLLATALANWHRYALALHAAGALTAAMHPLVRSSPSVSAAAAAAAHPRAVPGPWTGGQHPDARQLGMYRLLVAALHNPTAYGAFKSNPAVPDFITHELHNPSLAARWRSVVAHVPATVPDKYAAMAGEEQRFTHVGAPRISRAHVVIADSDNSASEIETDTSSLALEYLTVDNPDATGEYGGSVEVSAYDLASDGNINHETDQVCDIAVCTFAYPAATFQWISLGAAPASGAALLGWDGCTYDWTDDDFGSCRTTLNDSNATVIARFAQSVPLTITLPSWEGVADDFHTFWCASACTENLALGSTATLTAEFAPPLEVTFWTGCDQTSGFTCGVTMAGPRTVQEHLGFSLTVATQSAATGFGGTVTDSSGAIDCGEVPAGVTSTCAADLDAGQTTILTARPDANSTFSGWTGCPQASGSTCTVTMSQAQNVSANFAPPPPSTYPLSITVTTNNPAHTGYVTSSPSGIDCGAVPSGDTSTCTGGFGSGQEVTLTAVPNMGGFDLWTGCDSTAGYVCHVAMDQAKTVVATFG